MHSENELQVTNDLPKKRANVPLKTFKTGIQSTKSLIAEKELENNAVR